MLVVDVLRYNPAARVATDARRSARSAPAVLLRERRQRRGLGRTTGSGTSPNGGIFVEHGVHFFDAAAAIDRPATAVQASVARRTAAGPVDMVSATVTHGPDVLATRTHGFTRAPLRAPADAPGPRQRRGSGRGWIPVQAVVDAWTDDTGVPAAEALAEQAPDGLSVSTEVARDAGSRSARGRGEPLDLRTTSGST